mmetsp:Transcript_42343/g.99599  ORF Transcript_42343/g.99599 Transcript_42343/m.99599 type:complete len:88 (+) Transcript_42343:722-985(+)
MGTCENYTGTPACARAGHPWMDEELHSLQRRLIELRMEHADLDAMIDRLAEQNPLDELALQRLKKRRLALRDMLARLEAEAAPDEPA